MKQMHDVGHCILAGQAFSLELIGLQTSCIFQGCLSNASTSPCLLEGRQNLLDKINACFNGSCFVADKADDMKYKGKASTR